MASEAPLFLDAARNVCYDLAEGGGGSQAHVLKALPKIVDAVRAFAFLRDTASKSAEKVTVVLDVPAVCTDATKRLYCIPHRNTSVKQQCGFLKKDFPSRCDASELCVTVDVGPPWSLSCTRARSLRP